MENRNLNSKSLVLGFILAVAILLSISAVGTASDVGRYQVSGSGNTNYCFVIDTKTGAVTKVYLANAITRKEYVDGETVQGFLNQ